ncbi:hypothetical protein P4200_14695 [Pseudomonas aeruginosa]|nr:hypothetical protein [Pseudomonas aeruginosa]
MSFHEDGAAGRVIELARRKEQAARAYEQANDERLGEDMRLLYVADPRPPFGVAGHRAAGGEQQQVAGVAQGGPGLPACRRRDHR